MSSPSPRLGMKNKTVDELTRDMAPDFGKNTEGSEKQRATALASAVSAAKDAMTAKPTNKKSLKLRLAEAAYEASKR